MTTEMTVRHNGGGEMSVYDRVADPLAFITEMGKVFAHSGACGCQSEAEGKLLALACMSERKNPFQLNREFHLIGGKLSMRSDAMLAKFIEIGGQFKWIADGEDGKSAALQLTIGDNTVTSRFSMEDAKRAKLVKGGSAWEKDPAAMLRARCISRGVRMIAPQIVAGTYTPEEIDEINRDQAVAPVRTKEEVQQRQAELQAMQVQEPQQAQQSEDVIDVEASPAVVADAEPVTEQPPFEVEEKPAASAPALSPAPESSELDKILLEIVATLPMLGMDTDKLVAALNAKNPAITSLNDLGLEQARKLASNLAAKAEEARKTALGE